LKSKTVSWHVPVKHSALVTQICTWLPGHAPVVCGVHAVTVVVSAPMTASNGHAALTLKLDARQHADASQSAVVPHPTGFPLFVFLHAEMLCSQVIALAWTQGTCAQFALKSV
jgi:hypothetical protein